MLKNFSKLLLCILFVQALSASLMMSAKELHSLNNISSGHDPNQYLEWLDLGENDEKEIIPLLQGVDAIYLGAILYFNPSNWTVWINDQTFTFDNSEDNLLKILKVSNHLAVIELKNSSLKPIKLRPSQTLLARDGMQIVNGDAREKHSSEKEQL